MAARKELTLKDIIVLKLWNPLKNVLKEIWGMATGKAALILLFILIIISVSAALTMPPGFLESWQSATYWEDNPVIAPPEWVKYFGVKIAPSIVDVRTKPDIMPQWNSSSETLVFTYRFEYTLSDPVLPQDYYFVVSGVKAYNGIPPVVTISVERPDGISIVLWNKQVSMGENETTATYKTDPGEIILNNLVNSIIDKYNITLPMSILGNNSDVQKASSSLLKDRMRSKIAQPAVVLSVFQEPINVDNWVIVLREQQLPKLNEISAGLSSVLNAITNDPANLTSLIEQAKSKIDYLISNINEITFSDLYDGLNETSKLLSDAYKKAMIEGYPIEVTSAISDVARKVAAYMDNLRTTVSFIDINPAFTVLTGTYRFELNVTYSGVTTFPANPLGLIDSVKFTVKGTAKGILGTINNGADLATLLYYGFPVALLIGLVASVASTLIGVVAGIVSGYYGGWIDEVIQRTVDVLNNIPFLPLMIIISDVVTRSPYIPTDNRSFYIIMIYVTILILFSWTGLAIVVRSMTLSIKEEAYIEAARAMGASNRRIIFYHIFPQVMMYAVATLVYNVPSAILTEAGLSVLGLKHGWPTWGAVLAEARAAQLAGYSAWWWILPPGLLLSLTSLTFVLLGLAVEKIVEPRLRTL